MRNELSAKEIITNVDVIQWDEIKKNQYQNSDDDNSAQYTHYTMGNVLDHDRWYNIDIIQWILRVSNCTQRPYDKESLDRTAYREDVCSSRI